MSQHVTRLEFPQKKTVTKRLEMTSGGELEPTPINFTNWIVILTAIANIVLSLIIIFMGIQSTQFDYAGLLVVNWALMSLGFIVICLSIAAIVGIVRLS